MSYLCGPLTRSQIKTLMHSAKSELPTTQLTPDAAAALTASSSAGPSTAAAAAAPARAPEPAEAAAQNQRPVLPAAISQFFIPIRSDQTNAGLVYQPMVMGAAEVRFTDKTVDTVRNLTSLAPIVDGAVPVDWGTATAIDVAVGDLEKDPQQGAGFGELPGTAGKAKNYDGWKKDFANWIYRNQKLDLFKSASLNMVSNPDESERDFRIRLQQSSREARDAQVEDLRQKYAPKIAALEERRRRAEQAVDREAEQAKSQKLQTAISFGATLLSSFLGRKTISLSTLGRATTAARGVSRSMKESQDVDRAQDTVEAIAQQQADLDAQFKAEADAIEKSGDSQTAALDTVTLKPTKANIAVKIVTLAWAPYWQDQSGQSTAAWE